MSKCYVCNKVIDRSDAQNFWVTITRKGFWFMDKGIETAVPTRRLTLCSICGGDAIVKLDDKK
jgi:hypothetical protein